uniref:Cyclic nucleotide-binding domain-containing protein n=1 Tax=Meloidogyne floridensis TaxID=298350 RepID=A0A915NVQ8_9BILA
MHVTDLKRLAKKYFHSFHFLMDILALLPFDLILLINKGISLSRFNRLAKCYRVWQFVQMTNVRTNYPNAFRILHIVVVCVVLFHWNAALYFKISLIYGIFTTDASAWEFNYLKNQDVWCVRCGQMLWAEIPEGHCSFNESGLGDPDIDRVNYLNEMVKYWENRSMLVSFSNFSKQYSLSFYWSSLTLTTSGQQPYPTAAMHNSLEIFDTIVGVSTMNIGRAEIQQLNDGIKFYMKYRNVSATMQKRVLDCINYIQRHAQIQDEGAVLGTIPPRLRGELAVHLHLENLRRIELFTECEPSLLYELVIRFTMKMFAPNDFLCRSGDLAKDMFVLKRGTLDVLSDNGEHYSRLTQGGIFGEMAILKPLGPLGKLLARRRYSLRSVGYSEVYLLSQEDALDVFSDYPATSLLLENNEIHLEDLAEKTKFNPFELSGTESVNEIFQLLKETLDTLDKELDTVYAN